MLEVSTNVILGTPRDLPICSQTITSVRFRRLSERIRPRSVIHGSRAVHCLDGGHGNVRPVEICGRDVWVVLGCATALASDSSVKGVDVSKTFEAGAG